MECNKNIEKIKLKYRPSLFQHIGQYSSLLGKVQDLKVNIFVGLKVFYQEKKLKKSLFSFSTKKGYAL